MSDETVRIDDGGPAFPIRDENELGAVWCSATGMSLRDYFAAKAMPFCFEHYLACRMRDERNDVACVDVSPDSDGIDAALVSEKAYAMADAMLAARKAGGE